MAKQKFVKTSSAAHQDKTKPLGKKQKWVGHASPGWRALSVGILFLVGVVTIDFVLDLVFKPWFMRTRISDENQGNKFHQALAAKADAYIFGDSRAQHHYDPKILEQYTGLRFFNAGVPGRGVLTMRFGAQWIEQRQRPTLYLVNLSLTEFEIRDLTQRQLPVLHMFAPYKKDLPVYDEIIQSVRVYDKKIWGKFAMVHAYRYRTHIQPMIFQACGQSCEPANGFVPLVGTLNTQGVGYDAVRSDLLKPHYYMMEQFANFVQDAQQKNIRVVGCIGPAYRGATEFRLTEIEWEYLQGVRQLLKLLKVPFIEIPEKGYPEFQDPSFYFDAYHLNAKGAQFFSDKVGRHLKHMLWFSQHFAYEQSPYCPRIKPNEFVWHITLENP